MHLNIAKLFLKISYQFIVSLNPITILIGLKITLQQKNLKYNYLLFIQRLSNKMISARKKLFDVQFDESQSQSSQSQAVQQQKKQPPIRQNPQIHNKRECKKINMNRWSSRTTNNKYTFFQDHIINTERAGLTASTPNMPKIKKILYMNQSDQDIEEIKLQRVIQPSKLINIPVQNSVFCNSTSIKQEPNSFSMKKQQSKCAKFISESYINNENTKQQSNQQSLGEIQINISSSTSEQEKITKIQNIDNKKNHVQKVQQQDQQAQQQNEEYQTQISNASKVFENKALQSNKYLFECPQQNYQQFSSFLKVLLNQSLQKSKYISNAMNLLLKATPKDTIFKFEVNVYKNMLKTEYQLWVQIQEDQMRLIASAYNQNMNIDKSIFTIQQIGLLNQRKFVAELQSNFVRDKYNLYGYGLNSQIKTGNSFLQNQNIMQLANISLRYQRTFYIPGEGQNNQFYKFTKNDKSDSRDLQNKYRQNQNYIHRYKSTQFFKYNQSFYDKLKIRQSKKTITMMSEQTNFRLFIGKKASKKYKMMVGQSVSPLQAFAFLIAHVQNN